MAAMCGKRKFFFENCMVKEIEANLCFSIFGHSSKIQNGRHFWGGEFFFLKIAKTTLLRYAVV